MGRYKRAHAPGMVFHLVSRLHRREPLFVPALRGEVASLIGRVAGRTDARLLAYAVMPNHLHIVLRQGQAPLAAVMQPLMRRVAHRVQTHHAFEGAVVERRYRDRLCATPDHVREAIVYVHLNPWRAGLCEDDLDYGWMTHRAYIPGANPTSFGIDPHAQISVLGLFAQNDGRSRAELCEGYLVWFRRRMEQDRIRSGNGGDTAIQPAGGQPDPGPGDRAWRESFALVGRESAHRERRQPLDLHDFVEIQLARWGPEYKLVDLRGSWLPRPAARCRTQVIRAVAAHGYATGKIARLFGIAPSTVSTAKYSRDDES